MAIIRRKVVHNEVISLITLEEDPVLSESRRRGWYLASRCSVHVCNSIDMFVDYHPWNDHEVILDNNNHVDVLGFGKVMLRLTTGKVLTLLNVFHIPAIQKCLVSVGKLAEPGLKISFEDEGVIIVNDDGILGECCFEDGLIRLMTIEE